MKNRTIADVYSANQTVHEQLKSIVENLTDEQVSQLPEGEVWTIAQFVEHIGIVDKGMLQICRKLLADVQPDDEKNDEMAVLSDNFKEKAAQISTIKLEAPERVCPKGGQTIADSLAIIEESRAELENLRPLFASINSTRQTFPHPFMGPLTAHEWLTLIGAHEARHVAQLKRYIEKV